jgi:hypothetical protein
LHASNAPHVDANSINFQVRSGISVPSSVHIASISTYPALVDVFPAYRDDSFFVVEDEVVIVDRDRRIVDVVPIGPRARFAGGSSSSGHVTTVALPPDDIRVIQHALIDRGLLHGDADGVWGPETREAITAYQRQQGIAVTGGIDMHTAFSLGVSGRLSQQANQKIQSQSSSTDAQTSTGAQTTTGRGQGQGGQMNQPSNQQNATGQTPRQNSGQAQNPTSSTTGQNMPNQSKTTGQANETSQSGSSSTANQPSANQSVSSGSSSGSPSPAHRSGPNR